MRAGDVVRVDFGEPVGSEAGFICPAVVISSDVVLESGPRTIHVVPVTTNVRRGLTAEVVLADADLAQESAAQVHLSTTISVLRVVDVDDPAPNVGRVHLAQIRSVMADLLDIG